MKSRIFNLDWQDFDYRNPEHRKQLAGAMQYFCAIPNRFIPGRFSKVAEFVKSHGELHKAQTQKVHVQEFGLPSDFPVYEKAIEVIEKFHLATDFDNGYEAIFDVRDFSGTKASGFDVSDVTGGLAFNQVLPGEKLPRITRFLRLPLPQRDVALRLMPVMTTAKLIPKP